LLMTECVYNCTLQGLNFFILLGFSLHSPMYILYILLTNSHHYPAWVCTVITVFDTVVSHKNFHFYNHYEHSLDNNYQVRCTDKPSQ
jgi:hypothetical protein